MKRLWTKTEIDAASKKYEHRFVFNGTSMGYTMYIVGTIVTDSSKKFNSASDMAPHLTRNGNPIPVSGYVISDSTWNQAIGICNMYGMPTLLFRAATTSGTYSQTSFFASLTDEVHEI